MTVRPAPTPRLATLAAVVLAACAACGGGTGSGAIAPTPPPASPSVATPTSPPSVAPGTAGPSAGPSSAIASPSPDLASLHLALSPVVSGLTSPLLVTSARDGSGRLFVVEQAGRIRIVRDGTLVAQPFLDITGRVGSGGERGLLGLAFHPGFDGLAQARFYVDYTDRDGNTVIAELRVDPADPDRADPSSERVLLGIDQPFANHNGGGLAFGPDGYLYIGMGDGGSGGDPQGNGQRLDTRLGKLLRIDVDAATTGAAYGIPPSNPYASVAGAAPEIWAVGLRNPWRFSFDRATGDLWIGDVGQARFEEVDRAPATEGGGRGANYGWNRMEGTHCYPSGDPCAIPGLALPVAEYSHDEGCAVTGGYVYRGASQPALLGAYVFGDYCSGRLWALAAAGPDRQPPTLVGQTGASISSFGEDDAGELYVADIAAGTVSRLVLAPG